MSDHFSELKKLEIRDEKIGHCLKIHCVLRWYFAPKTINIHSNVCLGVVVTVSLFSLQTFGKIRLLEEQNTFSRFRQHLLVPSSFGETIILVSDHFSELKTQENKMKNDHFSE